ncbi:hypothetical protein [Enterococcus casseliflavus]|uniref:hypothetical protein n=1 Tax=Enterococcus casseliflavus TaxID=37734 RepID=UPI0039A6BB37
MTSSFEVKIIRCERGKRVKVLGILTIFLVSTKGIPLISQIIANDFVVVFLAIGLMGNLYFLIQYPIMQNQQAIGKTILTLLLKGKLTCENGVFSLEDICLVAGLGGISGKGNYQIRDGSYDYYVSEPVVCDDAKGIGPFLYAYSEWLLL